MQQTITIDAKSRRTFVRKMFFSIIFIMMLTALISAIVVVMQGICIQRFMGTKEEGAKATAAEQIGLPFFAFGTFFCYTFGFGLQILISKNINTSEKEKISYYFTSSMILTAFIALIFSLVGTIFSDQLAWLLGAEGTKAHLREYASMNIKGYFAGFIFYAFFRVVHPCLYLDKARSYTYISTAAMVGTCVASFMLVSFLMEPSPEKMFMYGFSTSAPYLGGLLVFAIYFIIRRKNTIFRLKFRGLKPFHFGHLFGYGLPSGLRKFSFSFSMLLLNFIIISVDGKNGPALAASGIQMHYQTLLTLVSSSIFYSGSVMSAYFSSLKDKKYFNDVLRFIAILCATFMVAWSLLFIAIAEPLVNLYGADNKQYVKNCAVYAIRCYAGTLPFLTYTEFCTSIYQGTKNVKWMYVSIVWQDFFPLVFVAAFAFGLKNVSYEWSIRGIFIGELVGMIMTTVFHFFLGWVVNKGKPFTGEAQFLLDKKKYYHDNQVLWSDLNNSKQWSSFKLGLNKLLINNKIKSDKKVQILTLVNSITNKTKKVCDKNKKYTTAVRIACDEGKCIINLMDTIKPKTKNKHHNEYIDVVKQIKHNNSKIIFNNTFNVDEFGVTV